MDKRVQQLSLLDEMFDLSKVLSSAKSDMRRLLSPEGEEFRKGFVGKLNSAGTRCGGKITRGNESKIPIEILNKILSPSDTSHPPSILFVLVFCTAAKNFAPLGRMVAARPDANQNE